MNYLKLRNYFILCFSLFMLQAQAIDLVVTGRVVIIDATGTETGLPSYPVNFLVGFTDTPIETTTNVDGVFEYVLNVTPAPELNLTVSVFDFCTGTEISQTYTLPDQDGAVIQTAPFMICDGINPPPPTGDCEAFIGVEQITDYPLIFQFYDLSYSHQDTAISSWHWDFGDGFTSDEQNPVHEFSTPGNYVISLTITAGDCEHTTYIDLWVGSFPCDCWDIPFELVCVADRETGDIIPFINPCYAACEGYNQSDFVDCGDDIGCPCPEYLEPVCVTTASGEVLVFDNPCFAACEGFSEGDWEYCDGNPPACHAIFDAFQVEGDSLSIQFRDSSTTISGQVSEWLWDFGDGNTSTEQNPDYSYEEAGVYPVSLIITSISEDGEACTSTLWASIEVGNSATCECSVLYQPACVEIDADSVLTFTNACIAECLGYDSTYNCNDPCACNDIYDPVCIDLGGGLVFPFPNACLAACAGFGDDQIVDCDSIGTCICPDIFDPVCVVLDDGTILTFPNACHAECEGYFHYTNCDGNQGCHAFFDYEYTDSTGLVIQFFDGSSTYNDGDEIVGWVWDFGDGQFSEEQSPLHAYEAEGIFTVVLKIITANGCESSRTISIHVGEMDPCFCPTDEWDPVCVATPSGEIITFSNACFAICAGFTPDMFTSCDPNHCVCTTEYNPVCVLSDDGTIITFSNACVAECEGYTEDQFVDCEDPGCGCPLNYDPVCVETGAGVITFPNACVAECEGFSPDQFVECEEICVCPEYYDPVCVLSSDGDTLVFSNICFAECEGYSQDDVLDECNTGGICDCPAELDPVCILLASGEFLVFPNACFAECEGYGPDLYVDCDNPGYETCHADFTIEYSDDDPLTVQFFDASFLNNDLIIQWNWDFGDGNTSEQQNPIHTYAEEGVYEVTLEILTSDECSSRTTQHICIGEGGVFGGPDCMAMFFYTQNSDDPLTFTFSDLSFGDVTSWQWNFGDGFTSDEQNPTHTYAEPGIYFVTLTITGEECQNTVSMLLYTDEDIWYNNTCTALFLPIIIPDSNVVFFFNLSSPDATEFLWDFGDGTTSTDPLVVHEYQEDGVYEVTLTITTPDGCSNSFGATINLGNSDFTGNPAILLLTDTKEIIEPVKEVKLFPNPSNNNVNLTFEAVETKTYQLDIFSMSGKQIKQIQSQTAPGTNSIEWNVSDWPAGLYLAKLQTANAVKTLKFVVKN